MLFFVLERGGVTVVCGGVLHHHVERNGGRPDRGRSLSMHLRLEDGPRLELPTCGAQAMVDINVDNYLGIDEVLLLSVCTVLVLSLSVCSLSALSISSYRLIQGP